MKSFREYLNEQKELDILVEAASNLKGLPKNIIRRIVSNGDSGLGGVKTQNSNYLNLMQNNLI